MKLTQIIIVTTLVIGTSSAVLASNMPHEHISHDLNSQFQQLFQAKGIVKSIDLTNNKITITHEPIAELGWPAMTMRFTAEDNELLKNVQVNDNVNFSFVQQGNLSILRHISIAQ